MASCCNRFYSWWLFIRALDYVIPHIHQNAQDKNQQREGVKTSLGKNTLLVLAITLHNIPEGLSIGVAFGALSQVMDKPLS